MTLDLQHLEWLTPWSPLAADDAAPLERELMRELSAGHVLHGRKLRALARRSDQDDVLFLVGDVGDVGDAGDAAGAPEVLAVVHLSHRKETRPELPSCIVFESVEELMEGCLRPDHLEFTDEDQGEDQGEDEGEDEAE